MDMLTRLKTWFSLDGVSLKEKRLKKWNVVSHFSHCISLFVYAEGDCGCWSLSCILNTARNFYQHTVYQKSVSLSQFFSRKHGSCLYYVLTVASHSALIVNHEALPKTATDVFTLHYNP